ncbi:MAG: 3-hydroxybutyryl-CoA dehydrogenase [Clostridiales bacterium]|nr:3-hydroxybutyryl-CoA dehydrogenase [Clostridiales bacterium]
MIVGIIGAGTMGMGIAQVFAMQEENTVKITSSSIASAQRSKDKLQGRLLDRVKKGKAVESDVTALLEKIGVCEIKDLYDCDLIIETIKEDYDAKVRILKQVIEVCKEGCVLATNTSSLSITEMATAIDHNLIGMHFFNPAPVMKLVEVVIGLNTPQEDIDFIMQTAEKMGKCPIEVKDQPGFVVNRMLIPMINEAIAIYAEGTASAESIDNAMRFGANHPMGPLQLGDLIGLDVCMAILEVLYAETGNSRYFPHPLLRKMVRGGWLGRKSGRGFYTY